MSVWWTESFRGQILWDVTKGSGISEQLWLDFAKKCILSFEGGVLPATGSFDEVNYPTGMTSEILASKQKKTFMDIFYRPLQKGKNGKVTEFLVKRTEEFHVGLSAVYKLFYDLTSFEVRVEAAQYPKTMKWVRDFLETSLVTTSYSARTQPKVMEQVLQRIDWKMLTVAEKWLEKGSRIRNLITMRWNGKAMRMAQGNQKIISLDELIELELPIQWSIYFDNWVTYIVNGKTGETFALTTVDFDRLQQMCYSTAMLHAYLALYKLPKSNSDAYDHFVNLHRRMERILHDAFLNTDHLKAQTLCRDLKKAFSVYLSMASGPLSDKGTEELVAEIKAKKYDKSFGYSTYISALCAAPFDVAQDLGRIYKLLPAPDYDIGASFVARYKQVSNPHPITEILGPNECTMEEWRKYTRKFMIQALIRANKGKGVGAVRPGNAWAQKYFESGEIPYGLDWVDQVNLRNTFRYVERHVDSALTYKDTAACEEDLNEAMDDQPALYYKRNMLLRYLFDESCPDINKARRQLTRKEHVHRVGFKMEAHKPEARLFYIGNMSDRIIQSELEENTHRLGSHIPGYMIGQSEEFKVNKTMGMVAPVLDVTERVFYFNFDLKEWSPGMPLEPQMMIRDILAEIFDREEYRNSIKITRNAAVILNKRGYKGAYINPVADFEGYVGKQNTIMHCALMGYAVYRYKRATKHNITIDLCAFIDDGLATFVDKVENGVTRYQEFVRIIVETYKALGFILELSKCYLSDRFAIFLNEIYFAGRHITYGLRAAMRIGTAAFEKHETIFDRLGAFAAGCQGAMKAGMDLISAYTMFLWSSCHILLDFKYQDHMNAKAAALCFYTPKFAHGLQQPNLIQMASNMASDGMVEAISTIQGMAAIYEPYRPYFIAIVSSDVATKTDTGILTSPRTIKPAKAGINENRLQRAVARRLQVVTLAPKARKLISIGKGFKIQDFARTIVADTLVLVESVLNDITDALPTAILNGLVRKFESSRTISQFIGPSRMKSIARENRRDVHHSATCFKHLVDRVH